MQALEPDALVADIGMPDEDGYSMLRRIRQLPGRVGRIPAIALSGYASEDDRALAMASGFRAHFAKPFDADSLTRTLALVPRTDPAASS